MEYAQIHFGKPLGQLTYEDIEKFFSTEREETDQLEFKSYSEKGGTTLDSMLTILTQGITAFLNSSGGMLIWGAPEGIQKPGGSKKEKLFVGNLTKVPDTIEKDWLISKVSDKIIPLPSSIRVQLIPKDTYLVCVFEIDESRYSPHQTDGTYYMRIDGQKKPAPHHYVEALFKKISYPHIEAYIKPYDLNEHSLTYDISIDFYFINYSPFENEEEFNYKIVVYNGRFAYASVDEDAQPEYSLYGSQYKPLEAQKIFHYGEMHIKTKRISFHKTQQINGDKSGAILVSFGGKKSPMKMNMYSVDLNNFDKNNADSIKFLFEIDYENKLMSDIHSEKGFTKDSNLKYLGVLRREL